MKILSVCNIKSSIYLDAIAIRHKVFVEEQQVSPEIEIDKNEALCIHFVLYNDENTAIATARLLPDSEKENFATLQRMAVLKEFRGKGYGRDVIVEIETFAKLNNISEIVLHAQLSAKNFYTKMRYISFGDEFEEAHIKHICMKKVIFLI
ncbi:MAG: GNAT family N-acetyltransferase [Bacteroidales bacterium]|jgi:predicted GNAT family N-acyltransferase|nr:GNAT family N-acetyltransferase [Bacteroidales bacterium]